VRRRRRCPALWCHLAMLCQAGVMVTLCAFIPDVFSSITGPDTGYHDWLSRCFPQPLNANSRIILRSGHDCIFPNPLFTYHPTIERLCSLDADGIVNEATKSRSCQIDLKHLWRKGTSPGNVNESRLLNAPPPLRGGGHICSLFLFITDTKLYQRV
jgi:hypothetical protein